MELTANKQQGVSGFYRDERKTENGVHVGFVCDAPTEYCAKISTFVWAQIKRNTKPRQLIKTIFNGVK